MTKVKPDIRNGVELVQLSNLPFDQYQNIIHWLPSSSFISQQNDAAEEVDFVYYDHYEYWFDRKYINLESPEFEF